MDQGGKRLPIPKKAQAAVAPKGPSCKVIGLDLSIANTGYCGIGSDGRPLFHGKVGSKVQENVGDVERFTRQVEALLECIKPEPDDLIVIENYAFAGTGQITRLSEYAGLVKYYLVMVCKLPEKNITFAAPGTMKKFITGKGNAEKDQILKATYQRWGMDLPTNDVADAFGLAALGFYSRFSEIPLSTREQPLSSIEKEAVAMYKKGNQFFGPVEKKTKKKIK